VAWVTKSGTSQLQKPVDLLEMGGLRRFTGDMFTSPTKRKGIEDFAMINCQKIIKTSDKLLIIIKISGSHSPPRPFRACLPAKQT